LAWLRDPISQERKTMLACWGGCTLDGFDRQLYSYVVPPVITAWSMSTGKIGIISTVTVVTSFFGDWVAGALADRFGRVRVLQIAILWYSIFTFLCAFPPGALRRGATSAVGCPWDEALSALGLAFYTVVLTRAFAVRSAAGLGAVLVAMPMLAFVLPVSTAVSITTSADCDHRHRDWVRLLLHRSAR
jgi:MFS family permease